MSLAAFVLLEPRFQFEGLSLVAADHGSDFDYAAVDVFLEQAQTDALAVGEGYGLRIGQQLLDHRLAVKLNE